MTPFPYTAASKAEIELDNNLIGKYKTLDFQIAGQSYTLVFRKAAPNYRANFGLKISDSTESLWVGLSAAPELSLLDEDLQYITFSNLPNDISTAILETVLADLLNSAGNALQSKLAIEEILFTPPPYEHNRQLFFTLKTPNQLLSGHLDMSEVVYKGIAEKISTLKPKKIHSFNSIPLAASIVLGKTTVSNAELKAVRENDIILIDGNNFIENKTLSLILSSEHQYPAQYDNGKITTQ